MYMFRNRPSKGAYLPPLPKRTEAPYDGGGVEPPLAELLADPIMDALWRRDGIGAGDVKAAIAVARQALEARSEQAAA